MTDNHTIFSVDSKKFFAVMSIVVAAFFHLCGYEIIRSVSQSLYIGTFGAKNLPWVMALGPVGLLVMIFIYNRLLSVYGAKKTMMVTCLFSGLAMLVCWWGIQQGVRLATAALYVLREAYLVFLVEQTWSFINSILNQGEGKRLNGPICGLAGLGAIAGGFSTRFLVSHWGTVNLIWCVALLFIPAVVFVLWAFRLGGEPKSQAAPHAQPQDFLGVRELFANRSLRYLLFIVILAQIVCTLLDLQLSHVVQKTFTDQDARTRWFGTFYGGFNAAGMVLQFLIVPFVLQVVKPRILQMFIPLLHAVFIVLSFIYPSLMTAAAAFLVFKMMDYSLFRASKELLYVPLSFDARYRAKQIIDSFAYRFSKGGTSLLLSMVGLWKVVPAIFYPAGALVAALTWIGVAFGLTKSVSAQSQK